MKEEKKEADSMFCTKCGLCLPDTARFCTRCGTSVAPRPAAPVYQQPTPVNQPVYHPAPQYQSVQQPVYYPPNPAPSYPPRAVYQQPVPQIPVYYQAPVYQQPVGPAAPVSAPTAAPIPTPAPILEPAPESVPAPMPESAPESVPAPIPESVPESVPAPMPEPAPEPVPAPVPPQPYVPPYINAAPAAPKKKFGAKVAIVVVVSALLFAIVGVAIWGFADGWLSDLFTSQANGAEDDNDDSHNSGKSGNSGDSGSAASDLAAYECDGLTIYLGEGYKESYRSDTSVTYDNFYVIVYVTSYETQSMGEGIVDSASFARSYSQGIDSYFDTMEIKTSNGVSYIKAQDDDADNAELYGCYVDGDRCWIVRVSVYDLDRYGAESIAIVTSGKIN